MAKLFHAALIAALVVPSLAKAEGFQTTEACGTVLENATDLEKVMLAAWVTGYLDRVNENPSTLIRLDNAQVVLRNIARACQSNPDRTILELVAANKKNTAETVGSKANAELYLRRFLQPGADLTSLTAAMRPTEADIRAVYAPELAERLVPHYASMFTPEARIGPKPDQTALLTLRATTGSLKRGEPALEDFPGGYEDVRPYLLGEFPIVRFKFVEPGKTTGLAFDGLIHVNGRWVLMPKPWRALGG